MSRDLHPETEAATQADHVVSVTLATFDFASGAVHVTNAPFDIDWDGMIFLGAGGLGSVSELPEGLDRRGEGIQVTLSGVQTAHLAIALNENYQGRKVRVWEAWLDADHRIVGEPEKVTVAIIDNAVIRRGAGDDNALTIRLRGRWADWDRPRTARYTDAEQHRRFPEDTALRHIDNVVDREIPWGMSGR